MLTLCISEHIAFIAYILCGHLFISSWAVVLKLSRPDFLEEISHSVLNFLLHKKYLPKIRTQKYTTLQGFTDKIEYHNMASPHHILYHCSNVVYHIFWELLAQSDGKFPVVLIKWCQCDVCSHSQTMLYYKSSWVYLFWQLSNRSL